MPWGSRPARPEKRARQAGSLALRILLDSSAWVVDLSRSIALDAADLSLTHGLAMADSLVLAHALAASATLVTLDNDFARVPQVKVLR